MMAFPALRLALGAGLATLLLVGICPPRLSAEPAGFHASQSAPLVQPGTSTSYDAEPGQPSRSAKSGRRKTPRRGAHLAEPTHDDHRKSARTLGLVVMLAAAAVAARAAHRRSRDNWPPQRVTLRPALARWRGLTLAGGWSLLAASGFLMLYGPDWLGPLLGSSAFSEVYVAAKFAHIASGAVMLLALAVALSMAMRAALAWLWRLVRGTADASSALPTLASLRSGLANGSWLADGAARFVARLPAMALTVLVVTGISMLFPYEITLFRTASDVAVAAGLAHGPSVSLWRDMELTTLAHATAGFVLIAGVLLRQAVRPGRSRGGVEAAGGAARNVPREAAGQRGDFASAN